MTGGENDAKRVYKVRRVADNELQDSFFSRSHSIEYCGQHGEGAY